MEAKVYARRLYVYYVETQGRVAITESCEFALAEALRTAEERHAEQLRITYIVTRPNRRMLATMKKDGPCCTARTTTIRGPRH
jgi:meiotically up-regulated gene 157 (Mug157) protein